MIYTVMPDGVQMDCEEPQQISMEIGGRAAVGRLNDGFFTLGRLYSTDPRDYLNPQFFPGARRPVAECSKGTPSQESFLASTQVILSPRGQRLGSS